MYQLLQRIENIEKKQDETLNLLRLIIHQNKKIMTTQEQIAQDVANIKTSFQSISDDLGIIATAIADLKTKVAAGGDQTQTLADLDDLSAKALAIKATADQLAAPAAPAAAVDTTNTAS